MEALKKNEIREAIKQERAFLDPKKKAFMDQKIYQKVCQLEDVKQARWIYCYASLEKEVETKLLIQTFLDQGKKVALPKVRGREILFYQIASFDDLASGCMGILEPKVNSISVTQEDALMMVPGVAFTMEGDRLGYGGGYYDRFLNQEPSHKTIAMAYQFQIVAELPTQEHDQKVDLIITE